MRRSDSDIAKELITYAEMSIQPKIIVVERLQHNGKRYKDVTQVLDNSYEMEAGVPVEVVYMSDRKRVCCNCWNNIRTGEVGNIECHCAIDGHYIGYVDCFEHWCNRWRKDRKWDKESEQ